MKECVKCEREKESVRVCVEGAPEESEREDRVREREWRVGEQRMVRESVE